MLEKNLKIQGMHCASCASLIEKTLKKTPGVKAISVNYATEKASLEFDEKITDLKSLSKNIEDFGYSFFQNEIKAQEKFPIIPLIIALLSILIMGWEIAAQLKYLPAINKTLETFLHHLWPVIATYIFISLGQPYLKALWRFIKKGKANMDTLIGLGTGTAFLYSFIISAFENILKPFINVEHSYYDITIVVIVFISLGKFLENKAKQKTGDAIQKLLELQAKTALVRRGNKEIEILLEELMIGDEIIIKPGAKIPVDGIVIEGESYVNESMITGEPMPVSKQINEELIGGTINTSGSLIMKAKKVGQETLLSQIIKMVEDAQGSKAPIQALADKISAIFVPIVLIIAIISLILWLIIGQKYLGFSQSLSYGILSFVGVLVIACPCALGLATPTAIIVGLGKGARNGILIKDASTLQKLYSINTLVIDKTGTLTQGKPQISLIINKSSLEENEIIKLLASLEKKSEHPLAQAILQKVQGVGFEFYETRNFIAHKGEGVEAVINNQKYIAGSLSFIENNNLSINKNEIEQETKKGKTPIILASEKEVLAIIFVADPIKKEAASVIKDLKKHGLEIIMMTGDDQLTANYVANSVGIEKVFAKNLPVDKLNNIKDLQSQGKIVAMAGDGVNDAPALAQANVGLAMSNGTDVAIESSGITLLHGDISKIAQAIKLSKITMAGIKENLFWAFIYNMIGIPIASGLLYPFLGIILNPIFAGLAMALSSISVVMNSLRLKTKKL